MEYKLNKYSPEHINAVSALLQHASAFVREDILTCLGKRPENAVVVLANNEIIAIGGHLGKENCHLASLYVYVSPNFRRLKIGSALVSQLVNNIRSMNIDQIITDFAQNPNTGCFLTAQGFEQSFLSDKMVYNGRELPESGFCFRPYTDRDYSRYQEIQSHAFLELRRVHSCQPAFMLPSESERRTMAENPNDYFLLLDSGEIVAAAYAANGEIDDVAVDPDLYGRGYGRALVCHGVNKLLSAGYQPSLWVLRWNVRAAALYRALGFTTQRTHEFWILELQPYKERA